MELKSQIATTREQSGKLLALGLKPETADMCYNGYFESLPLEINRNNAIQDKKYIPAWTLARLLELMPKSLEQTNRPNADLCINSDRMYWFVTYEEFGYDVKHQEMSKDLFSALIFMIAWIVDNGYINKEYMV
jgi:hypothetical protein